MSGAPYDRAFYDTLGNAEPSARRILPHVLALAPVHSAVDVGCGDGGWLAAARALGVGDILGLDGPWNPADALKIPAGSFRRVRLDQPFEVGRRFDLAICVEVAEHLPGADADRLVGELCALAPMVLFSAAIPGQGGLHHVNEQWPAWWAARFTAHGRACLDHLRPTLWADDGITWWYRQNLLLFVDPALATPGTPLAAALEHATAAPPPLVHPELFAGLVRQARPRIGRWLKMAPDVLARTFGRR